VPADGLALTLTLVVALVVVGGMSTIGLLQISAMMVIPLAAAARVAGSYRGTLLLGSAAGGGQRGDRPVRRVLRRRRAGCGDRAGRDRDLRPRGPAPEGACSLTPVEDK
jgi:hypothetical protein